MKYKLQYNQDEHHNLSSKMINKNVYYRDNYGLGDRSCHNHTKLSYFIYNPRGKAEGNY